MYVTEISVATSNVTQNLIQLKLSNIQHNIIDYMALNSFKFLWILMNKLAIWFMQFLFIKVSLVLSSYSYLYQIKWVNIYA